jgi:hypothetical protein
LFVIDAIVEIVVRHNRPCHIERPVEYVCQISIKRVPRIGIVSFRADEVQLEGKDAKDKEVASYMPHIYVTEIWIEDNLEYGSFE